MAEYGKEYILSNRVFNDVKNLNLLLDALHSIVGETKKRVKRGRIRKTKKFRLVIKATPHSRHFGEVKIIVYDDDTKRIKFHERIPVSIPVEKMIKIRGAVLLFSD